jgi:hypothetical protein
MPCSLRALPGTTVVLAEVAGAPEPVGLPASLPPRMGAGSSRLTLEQPATIAVARAAATSLRCTVHIVAISLVKNTA